MRAIVLWNEPDRHRVAIEFSVARLDGGDDDEDGVQDPKDRQEKEADQDQAKDRGDDVVDEHRDLEVERFLAVRIDLGRVAALGQPDDERPEQVAGEMKKNAEQGAGVTKGVPGAHVGEAGALRGGGEDEVSMASIGGCGGLDGWIQKIQLTAPFSHAGASHPSPESQPRRASPGG